MAQVRRLDLGHLDSVDGRVDVLAYLVRHERGLLLFDTGIGVDAEVDAHYRPHRRDLRSAPELVDFAGARYEEPDGEAEIQPGVWIVPAPGHTASHQALVVRPPDGTVVLTGQSHERRADFAADHHALTAAAPRLRFAVSRVISTRRSRSRGPRSELAPPPANPRAALRNKGLRCPPLSMVLNAG